MNNTEKLLEIEKNLDPEGIELVSCWLLRNNGWIYTHRSSKTENKNIKELLKSNNINYTMKSTQLGEMLILT